MKQVHMDNYVFGWSMSGYAYVGAKGDWKNHNNLTVHLLSENFKLYDLSKDLSRANMIFEKNSLKNIKKCFRVGQAVSKVGGDFAHNKIP